MNTSIEDSLALLAPSLSDKKIKSKKSKSIPVPGWEETTKFDINTILGNDLSDEEDEVRSVTSKDEEDEVRSVASVTSVTSGEEEEDEVRSVTSGEEEEDEVRSVASVTSGDEEEDEVKSVTSGEDEEDEVTSGEDEVNVKTEKELGLTPKRFKMFSPKSIRKHEEKKRKTLKDLKNSFRNVRYTPIKYITNEENLKYILAFDPNGEIVFVELENEDFNIFDENKVIKIEYKDEDIIMSTSFVEGIKNKMSMDVFGVVMFDGLDYCILKRDEDYNIVSEKYTTISTNQKNSYLPSAYAVVSFTEMIKNPEESIARTKHTYNIIQNQQLTYCKETIKTLMETTKNLTKLLYKFDEVYKQVTIDTIKDWRVLSEKSEKFYSIFVEEELSDKDKESFDKVSLNMFARFQLFNDQVDSVSGLQNSIEKLNGSIYNIQEIMKNLDSKSNAIKGKIIEPDELEYYV